MKAKHLVKFRFRASPFRGAVTLLLTQLETLSQQNLKSGFWNSRSRQELNVSCYIQFLA